MIKIYIDKKMEDKFWNDMQTRQTGLVNVLNAINTINLLKGKLKYTNLYHYFYDSADKVRVDNVKKLLLADKTTMEGYIKKFGEFDKSEAKELYKNVFRYDTFSGCKCAYDMLENMNVTVCPYCNRQYTFTLKSRKARPQFDHYFPKSKYPYLALSMYNLIPSCGICNQAKSDLDTVKEPILYPYEEEFGEEIRFKVKNKTVKAIYGLSDEFDVEIEMDSSVAKDRKTKIEKQSEKLGIEELYNMHKDYIKDIALNHHINSPDRIDELVKKFPTLFKSKDDVKKSLYMNDIRKDNWGRRPLAKLTSDVIKALEKSH